MADRRALVKGMQDIFGSAYFSYAGYTSAPGRLPYSMYMEIPTEKRIKADDRVWIKRRLYVVRVVTGKKDWDLEDRVEELFDSLEFDYLKVTDEPFADEKVHVVEWEVEVIG